MHEMLIRVVPSYISWCEQLLALATTSFMFEGSYHKMYMCMCVTIISSPIVINMKQYGAPKHKQTANTTCTCLICPFCIINFDGKHAHDSIDTFTRMH